MGRWEEGWAEEGGVEGVEEGGGGRWEWVCGWWGGCAGGGVGEGEHCVGGVVVGVGSLCVG